MDILVIVLAVAAVGLMIFQKVKAIKTGGCCGKCDKCGGSCKIREE